MCIKKMLFSIIIFSLEICISSSQNIGSGASPGPRTRPDTSPGPRYGPGPSYGPRRPNDDRLPPGYDSLDPLNPSRGEPIDKRNDVVNSINTPFGKFEPSLFVPVNGKPVVMERIVIGNSNKLTNDEIVTLFNIPVVHSNNDPSKWQEYFDIYLNVAYTSVYYLFQDNKGNFTKSNIGKVKIDDTYKKIFIIMDMGRYKNIIYNKDARKAGYLFRTIIELTFSGANAIDITDIFSIAVSAKAGVIQGRIETQALGISGKALGKFLVPLCALNNETIQKAIISVAILNNKIAEGAPDVMINPELYPEDI